MILGGVFGPCHKACGILVPWLGIQPSPGQWEHRVLTTGLPRNFQKMTVDNLKKSPLLDPWVRKIPCRREWQLTPVFLPGEFHGQRSLAGYSPWGLTESETTEGLTLSLSLLSLPLSVLLIVSHLDRLFTHSFVHSFTHSFKCEWGGLSWWFSG